MTPDKYAPGDRVRFAYSGDLRIAAARFVATTGKVGTVERPMAVVGHDPANPLDGERDEEVGPMYVLRFNGIDFGVESFEDELAPE